MGFGGQFLFVGEEGEAAASSFDIEREARDERADFRLEVDVGTLLVDFFLYCANSPWKQ